LTYIPLAIPLLMVFTYSYIYVLDGVLVAVINIGATGLSLTTALARRMILEDKTWMIMLSSTIYASLRLIPLIPSEISLLVSLATLVALLDSTSGSLRVDSMGKYIVLSSIFAGVVGVVYGTSLLAWVMLSPLIEFMLANTGEDPMGVFSSLYNVVLYGLALVYKPIPILYMFMLSLLRLTHPFFKSPGFLCLDPLIRIVMLVIPWI